MNKARAGSRSRSGWLLRAAAVVFAALVIVGGVLWWQDRPLAVAETRLQAGDAAAALELLESRLRQDPQDSRALRLKARALVAMQQWDAAAEIFAQTGAGSPESLLAWGTAMFHQRQWDEALLLLDQVLAAEPDNARALQTVTACRYQLGYLDAARASATRLAELPGHEIEGLFQLGAIHRRQGDPHLALENWERVEALRPDATGLPVPPAEFFFVFAEDLMSDGRPRQALVYLKRCVELGANVEVLQQLGQASWQVGDHASATAAWTAVLQQDRQNRPARLGLAGEALSRGQAEAALDWLAPIEAEPLVTAEVAYLLQRAHTMRGDEDAATRWQERTAELRRRERLEAARARNAEGDN